MHQTLLACGWRAWLRPRAPMATSLCSGVAAESRQYIISKLVCPKTMPPKATVAAPAFPSRRRANSHLEHIPRTSEYGVLGGRLLRHTCGYWLRTQPHNSQHTRTCQRRTVI